MFGVIYGSQTLVKRTRPKTFYSSKRPLFSLLFVWNFFLFSHSFVDVIMGYNYFTNNTRVDSRNVPNELNEEYCSVTTSIVWILEVEWLPFRFHVTHILESSVVIVHHLILTLSLGPSDVGISDTKELTFRDSRFSSHHISLNLLNSRLLTLTCPCDPNDTTQGLRQTTLTT